MRKQKQRCNTLPRVHSPAGIKARQERRLKAFVAEIPKGGPGCYQACRPGSENPRKVGR